MEEVSVLIAKAQSGDKNAREVLIEKNLGLVHSIVGRFSGRGYDAEDLFQIGTIGLMKAVDKFDLSLQLKFSTYAVPLITGEIRRFLRDDGPVKISRTIKENSVKWKKSRQILQGQLGREPRIEELSAFSGLSMEELLLSMEASKEVESIDAMVEQTDGSRICLADRIVQGEVASVGVGFQNSTADPEKERVLDRILVKELLKDLSETDRELIILRYFRDQTQTQVAGRMGISQVQVSRLEKKILRSLREKV